MDKSLTRSLTSRVAQLERYNRRWRRAGLAVAGFGAVVIAVAAAFAATPLETVEAKRFVLKGQDGRERFAIETTPEGITQQMFFGKDGKPRIQLFAAEGGDAGLGLWAKGREDASLTLSVDDAGLPRVNFYEKGNDKPRIDLTLAADGSPILSFFDKDGKMRFQSTLLGSGSPVLSFIDKNEKVRLEFELDENGSPRLNASDKDGNPVELAPRREK